MIIKGNARAGTAGYLTYLTKHLQRNDTNELVRLRHIQGLLATNLGDALKEMAAVGCGSTTRLPLYHANIDPSPGEVALREDQMDRAVDELASRLGLADQPRVVIQHVKAGRNHLHVVYSRVQLATMRPIPDHHNYICHEQASRALEAEFGHTRVVGAFTARNGAARPERTPDDWEVQQGSRTGLDAMDARALVRSTWAAADTATAFVAAMILKDWHFARGDNRAALVLVDAHGGLHSVGRVLGIKAAELRARTLDIDTAALPTVAEVRDQIRVRGARGSQVDVGDQRNPVEETPAPSPPVSVPIKPSALPAFTSPRRAPGGDPPRALPETLTIQLPEMTFRVTHLGPMTPQLDPLAAARANIRPALPRGSGVPEPSVKPAPSAAVMIETAVPRVGRTTETQIMDEAESAASTTSVGAVATPVPPPVLAARDAPAPNRQRPREPASAKRRTAMDQLRLLRQEAARTLQMEALRAMDHVKPLAMEAARDLLAAGKEVAGAVRDTLRADMAHRRAEKKAAEARKVLAAAEQDRIAAECSRILDVLVELNPHFTPGELGGFADSCARDPARWARLQKAGGIVGVVRVGMEEPSNPEQARSPGEIGAKRTSRATAPDRPADQPPTPARQSLRRVRSRSKQSNQGM